MLASFRPFASKYTYDTIIAIIIIIYYQQCKYSYFGKVVLLYIEIRSKFYKLYLLNA